MNNPHQLSVDMLCRLLTAKHLLTDEQHREAIAREQTERARIAHRISADRQGKAHTTSATVSPATVSPVTVLAAMGFPIPSVPDKTITEQIIVQALADHAQIPYVHLDPLKIDVRLAAQSLSRPFARRHNAIVIGESGPDVTVAVADPFDVQLIENIKQYVGRGVDLRVAPPVDIQRVITDIYGFRSSVKAAERQFKADVDIGNLERYVRLKSVEDIEATDSHIVNAVEYLFHYAFDQRASDIHIEPHRDSSTVRMRIDGVLHDVNTLPKLVHPAVVSRIKTLAHLDIAEKRRPQDGRIKTASGEREVEIRVSSMAVAFGEKIVMRIFDPEVIVRDLTELGLFDKQLTLLKSFIYRPNGLVLVTGPTGSGKTTSLYSMLRDIGSPEVNVTTIEDPIEIVVDAFNQVEVQTKIDVTFPEALRHVLRQDPDIIMVGEVRDAETAMIAVQAALTGHLVLATLHTNDAASAITRLVELGIDPFLLSSTLVGVVAQRLVRKVCPVCEHQTMLHPDQMAALGLDLDSLGAQGNVPHLPVKEGAGCPKCRNTGLYGRTGIFEVFEMTDKLRRLVQQRSGSKELTKQAKRDGLLTLREAAIRKLAKGLTSFDEVLRVTVQGG